MNYLDKEKNQMLTQSDYKSNEDENKRTEKRHSHNFR